MHIKQLKSFKPSGLYQEILDEYLLSFDHLTDRLERLDKRIEELASGETYQTSVKKLTCFRGVRTQTALSVLVEIGDFQRSTTAEKFATYIGLAPGEDSSSDNQKRLEIKKAGNPQVLRLLVEVAPVAHWVQVKALKQCHAGEIRHKCLAMRIKPMNV